MYKAEYSLEPGDLVEKLARHDVWKGQRYNDIYCPVCHGYHQTSGKKFHLPHQRSWKTHRKHSWKS